MTEELALIYEKEVISTVCGFYGVKWEGISHYHTDSKDENIIFPRKVVEYCCVEIVGFNYVYTGMITGVTPQNVRSGYDRISMELSILTPNGRIAKRIIRIVKKKCDEIKKVHVEKRIMQDIIKYRSLLNKAIYEYETQFGEVPTNIKLQNI